MYLTDTHCHLDFKAFNKDRAEILARAEDAGLIKILNPGIDLTSSRRALELSDAHPQVYAAVGVHPNSALTWDGNTMAALRELAQHPKVVAIGEIGLDYYRDWAPPDIQRRVFQQQLELAGELGLPVVIHNRQASSDMMEMLAAWQVQFSSAPFQEEGRPGVLHSFSGEEDVARKALELNFFFGISGPVTFRKATELHNAVSALPLERLLIETDAPYLTPHPRRGSRNEPAYVRLVAERIAELHEQPLSQIAESTTANAARLFNWEVIS